MGIEMRGQPIQNNKLFCFALKVLYFFTWRGWMEEICESKNCRVGQAIMSDKEMPGRGEWQELLLIQAEAGGPSVCNRVQALGGSWDWDAFPPPLRRALVLGNSKGERHRDDGSSLLTPEESSFLKIYFSHWGSQKIYLKKRTPLAWIPHTRYL